MIRIGIFGATGYTGYELVKLLANHPEAEIVHATSRSSAGRRLSDLYPCPYDLPLIAPERAEVAEIDVAFTCLPHGESMPVVQRERAAAGQDDEQRPRQVAASFRHGSPTTRPALPSSGKASRSTRTHT